MPKGDGTGPRRTGRRNLRNGSVTRRGCARNAQSKKSQPALKPSGTSEPVLSVGSTLFGLAMAAVPVLLKLKNLLINTNQEKMALSEESKPLTITVEPKPMLIDEQGAKKIAKKSERTKMLSIDLRQ